MGYYILIMFIVITALYLYAIRGQALPEQHDWIEGCNFTHRGYYTKDQTIPENSIAAFKQSIKHKYGIEMDVQLSKDNQLFVFHDDDLKRMVSQQTIVVPAAKVTTMDYETLASYYLGNSTENIPLLSDALDLIGGKVPIYLELKDFSSNYAPLCDAVIALLANYSGRVAVASFNPYILLYFKKKAPQYMRIQIAQDFAKSDLVWWKKFLLQNLLLNFLTQPHAISYEYNKTNISFLLTRLMMMYTIGWAISNKIDYDTHKHLFNSVVFEHFKPD